jgi:hypothetical protein
MGKKLIEMIFRARDLVTVAPQCLQDGVVGVRSPNPYGNAILFSRLRR